MKIYSNETIKNKLTKKKRLKAIFGVIFYIIIIFLIICAIDILYQRFIKKDDSINLFGYKLYIVLSGSMEPNLNVGDVIIVKEVKEEQIEVDNIVTFVDEDGNIITHRIEDIIVKDGKNYYKTKGDNNNTSDVNLISIENIKGKYSLKINQAGKIISEIITPTGLMLLVLVLAIIYMNMTKKSDRKIARHLIRKRYEKQNII